MMCTWRCEAVVGVVWFSLGEGSSHRRQYRAFIDVDAGWNEWVLYLHQSVLRLAFCWALAQTNNRSLGHQLVGRKCVGPLSRAESNTLKFKEL